jgi:hypothetical protein
MHCEMQRIVRDDFGLIIPAYRNNIDAISKKIRGMTRVPLAPTGAYEWPRSVWLDT